MSIRVKVCGITRPEDVETAVHAGADALGFVLWEGSPRRVTAALAARLCLMIPPQVARVGVFVDEPLEALRAAAREVRLTTVQLHGEQDPEEAARLDVDWYRVFRVGAGEDPRRVAEQIALFGDRPFMLDTRSDAVPGGTGRLFDHEVAARIGRLAAAASPSGRARMILAGGLTPDNVAGAIRMLRGCGLWGVDVSSGVESSPGFKDPERVRRFVDAVRSAA